MADTADSPRDPSREITATPTAGALPVRGLAPPPAEPTEAYQSLSLLAVASLGMAILYAWFIAGMVAFTFFSGDLLYLPYWTFLLPLVIIILCLVARRSILHSEGTVGGERLVSWGLGLAVVFGLGYWAYHAATFLAAREQAVTFVNSRFISALTKGTEDGVTEAYILTYDEARPTVNKELRGYVETNLNTAGSLKIPGRYTSFEQYGFVRAFRTAAGKAEVTLKKVSSPVVESNKLKVPLLYHVETPLRSFDLLVMAIGSSGQSKEFHGRPWRIDIQNSGEVSQTSTLHSPEGVQFFDKIEPVARAFANAWVSKLTTIFDADGAYRFTLSPKERAELEPKIRGKSDTELANAAKSDKDVARYFDGLKRFRAGGVLRNEDKFFVSERMRQDVLQEIKKRFLAGFASSTWLQLPNCVPIYQSDGKTVRLAYDIEMQLLPAYIAAGRLIIEADADAVKDPSYKTVEAWRLVGLELVRASAAPKADSRTQPIKDASGN